MYTITKTFTFAAAHQLPSPPLEPNDPCGRLHGHSYIVELVLQAEELDENGMVVNFHKLRPFKQYLDEELDHSFLNEQFGGENTTSERLAQYFYAWAKPFWPQLVAVRVSEGGSTWAEYYETDHRYGRHESK